MFELGSYLKPHGLLLELLAAPSDLYFADDTIVHPDLLVADTSRFVASGDWRDITAVHLVIEIMSLSSRQADPGIKRALYQERGVATYWIVDPEHREMHVFTPSSRSALVCTTDVTWQHPTLSERCTIDLERLFDLR